MIFRGILAQAYCVFWINLVNFSYGLAIGWASPTLPLLRSDKSPLPSGPLSLLEASWVGAILAVGGAIGTIFYSWFCEKYGRKVGIISSGAFFFISWTLIFIADTFIYLLIARFLCGFGSGGMYIVIPLFVSEISDINVRGIFGSMLTFFRNFGIVFGYIICSYLEYSVAPWFGITPLVVFFLGAGLAPETPQFLIKVGKVDEGRAALEHYKDVSDYEIEKIFNELQMKSNEDQLKGLTMDEFKEPAFKRGIVLGVILMNITAFAGASTLTTYCATVFKEAGSTLSVEISSIIVASIQTVSILISTLLVEKAGRKFLLVIATYLCALCLIVMSGYLILRDTVVDITWGAWIPLVSLSSLMLFASIGPTPIPFVVLGEIFKQNIRSYMISFSLFTNWIVTFVLYFLFPYMIEYLKLYGALTVFASISIVLTTSVVILLPETKGLSIDAIVEMLGRSRHKK